MGMAQKKQKKKKSTIENLGINANTWFKKKSFIAVQKINKLIAVIFLNSLLQVSENSGKRKGSNVLALVCEIINR